MRILFLDMDEVLCTSMAHAEAGARAFDHRPASTWPFRCVLDRDAVERLNSVCEDVGDVLTVSCSTWRVNLTCEELAGHLRHFGWRGAFHPDWKTPYLNVPHRGTEIRTWLDRYPAIAQYAILDDNSTAGYEHAVERFCWIQHPYEGFGKEYCPILKRALLHE